MRILLIEDDARISDYLQRGLKEFGFVIDCVHDGADGLHMARGAEWDALIVDRMLPSLDGLTLIRTLRGEGNSTPVLILSALSDLEERIRGLQDGADDYLTKPYALAEVHARLVAIARRHKAARSDRVLSVGDLKMDMELRRVTRCDTPIPLHPREFRLLEYLMRNSGRVVTRTMMREAIWDYTFHPQTNVIDVHISRLRQKIDSGFSSPMIHTIRGAGYSLHA